MSKIYFSDLQLTIMGVLLKLTILVSPLIVLFLLIRMNRKRQINSWPTENIAEVKDGYRHLEGRAESLYEEHLKTPIGQVPCIWFDSYIDSYSRFTRSLRGLLWFNRYEGISCHHRSNTWFILRDSTGFCLVDTQIATIKPTRVDEKIIVPDMSEALPPEKRGRVYEQLIEVGASVTVLGHVATVPASVFNEIDKETGHYSHGFSGRHVANQSHEYEIDYVLQKVDTDVKMRIKALIDGGHAGDSIRLITSFDQVHSPVLIQGL